ncbi:hypothetical protein Goari_016580, partial [Gossypium aridum]|nr:hypothetical protein [Gossypium aridum]
MLKEGLQRVRFFIWTALQGRLLSSVERVRRGLVVDPSFPICGFHLEDILYILRYCVVAKDNRNLFIFQGRSWSLREIVQVSLTWANQLFSTLRADFKGSFKPPVEKKSFEDSIFLNTDGVVQLGFGNAAAGGVVRDANGDWIFGYNRCLGKCSIFNAELWGILEGLRLIQRR